MLTKKRKMSREKEKNVEKNQETCGEVFQSHIVRGGKTEKVQVVPFRLVGYAL